MSHRLSTMWKHRVSLNPPVLNHFGPTRTLVNSSHFYENRHVESYSAKETKRLTLRQLIFFGRSIDEEKLLKSANYVRTELPVRIAHRLRDLQTLPYVVVTQEGVAKVYELYCSAFEKFRRYPPITNLEENETYCHFLSNILNEHATVIPNLTLGLSLGSPFMPPDVLDAFARRMFVSRISRRVLAEHHIALSEGFYGKSGTTSKPHVGIIQTGLNVRESIEKCADLLRQRPAELEDLKDRSLEGRPWPEVVIDGHLETEFPYIPAHLEYIVFELLKNAIRATVINRPSEQSFPAIHATIAAGKDDIGIRISDQGGGIVALGNGITTPSDLFSFSHVRNAARMEGSRIGALRTISSSEQGMWATVGEQVDRWQQHDKRVESEPAVGLHTSIGIGLPMSNIYATYFGGSLDLVSLDGWGTDVYVRLPKLGTNLEGIEV